MHDATDTPAPRSNDLRRNLLLVASYIAILTLIAAGYQ